MMGVRATGQTLCFGTGTIVAVLIEVQKTTKVSDKLSVKTPASSSAHALSTQPGMPLGTAAI